MWTQWQHGWSRKEMRIGYETDSNSYKCVFLHMLRNFSPVYATGYAYDSQTHLEHPPIHTTHPCMSRKAAETWKPTSNSETVYIYSELTKIYAKPPLPLGSF
jgi:hypothetical protein